MRKSAGRMFLELMLGSYVLFEVNYFIRVAFTALSTKLRFRKKASINKDVIAYGICTTNDLDIFCHMNNSRYLREFEFGRFTFMMATGLYPIAHSLGDKGLLSAVSIRYRRSVTLFQCFRVRSRLIYWTERDLYFESYLETIHDDFVRAVSLSKLTFVGPASIPEILSKMAIDGNGSPSLTALPEMSPDLQMWVESNRISSEKLHKKV